MHPHYTIKFQWVHWGPVVSLNWCQTPPCGSICWETSLSYFLNNIFFPFCTLDLLHRLIYEFGSLFYPKQLMLHSGYIFFYFHAILGNQNHGCGIAKHHALLFKPLQCFRGVGQNTRKTFDTRHVLPHL